MDVTGVGSTFSYIYNLETKKLSTKDGSEDEFVKYFNGELEGSESETLNVFDAGKKVDMNALLTLVEQAGVGRTYIADSKEFEISGEIVDAATSVYSINGQGLFKAYTAVSYTYDEIFTETDAKQPFKTRQSKGYNPKDNSINIAVGDRFDLQNGYTLVVKDNRVAVEGLGKGQQEDDKARLLASDLASFIHFADQQGYGLLRDESISVILALLEELGVDTSKEFIVNKTKCEIFNGRIKEVGNVHVMPSSIYNKALKRYEEICYQPLSSLK